MLQYDSRITISAAQSRRTAVWPRQTLLWSEFVEKLKTPVMGAENMTMFLRLPKSQQDERKDVGGFVGGTFVGNRRRAGNVEARCLITLDFDGIPAMATNEVIQRVIDMKTAACVYSTRKHRIDAPRLRLIFPLSHEVSADEYEAIARKVAQAVGIEWCDPTTFEPSRLMYWPSVCLESPYIYEYNDAPFIDPDAVLASYGEGDAWKDTSLWPQVPGVAQKEKKLAERQEDPTVKKGIVGAFCRAYSIREAMDELIPGAYEPCDADPDRFTYTGGSTTGGAIIYEDKWLYSHHGTDPTGGQLVNAFDLVRLHKYLGLDENAKEGTPTGRLPSYKAMVDFAMHNEKSRLRQERESLEEVKGRFPVRDMAQDSAKDDLAWTMQLELTSTGKRAATIDNCKIVINNDPALAGKLAYNEFKQTAITKGALPWNEEAGERQWTDIDSVGLQHYFEKVWKLQPPKQKIDAAIDLCAREKAFHPVKEYLQVLTWDGKPRLDTLLVDYLGAEDSDYTRAVTRKAFAAAVARVIEPGIKFDYVLTLVGPQGIGKSTLLSIMGGDWFTDSLAAFDGKAACELIQGKWIVELGELSVLSKSEVETVKQFITRQDDNYRAAYARLPESHPRQCVFFGTTNREDFLRDETGNRRWWPVNVGENATRKNIFERLPGERDQVWSEAVYRYYLREPLMLDKTMEEVSRAKQEEHQETNVWEGAIINYIEKPLPENWKELDLATRRLWLSQPAKNDTPTVPRVRVCAAEVWCECLGYDLGRMQQKDTRLINSILSHLSGWKSCRTRFSIYGLQRGFCGRFVQPLKQGESGSGGVTLAET